MQMPDVGSLLLVVIMLGLLPFAAMVVTSYTKIVVVLGLLRNAIGVQQVPPNMVLNGVALLVSCFVMAPVGMEAFKAAQNYGAGSDNSRVVVLLDACREPFRQFLLKHTREREKAFSCVPHNRSGPRTRPPRSSRTTCLSWRRPSRSAN